MSRYFIKGVSHSEHCKGPHRNATSKSRALYQPFADKFKGSKDTCNRKTTKKGTVARWVERLDSSWLSWHFCFGKAWR